MSSFEIHDRVRHIGTGKILLVISKSAFIDRSSRMRPIPECIPYDKEDLYSYVTEEKNEKWVGTALNSRLVLISRLSERSPSKKVVIKRTHEECPRPKSVNKGFKVGERVVHKEIVGYTYTVMSESDYIARMGKLPMTNADVVLVESSSGRATFFPDPEGLRRANATAQGLINPGFNVGDRIYHISYPNEIYTVASVSGYENAGGLIPKTANSIVLVYRNDANVSYFYADDNLRKVEKKIEADSCKTKVDRPMPASINKGFAVGDTVALKSRTDDPYTVISEEEYKNKHGELPYTRSDVILVKNGSGGVYFINGVENAVNLSLKTVGEEQAVFPIGSMVTTTMHPGQNYMVIDAKTYSDKTGRGTLKDRPDIVYLYRENHVYTWDYVKYLKLVAQPVPADQTKWAVGDMVTLGNESCYEVTTREEWVKKQTSGVEPASKDAVYVRHSNGEVSWTTFCSVKRKATAKEIALFLCPLDKEVSIRGMLVKRTTYMDYVSSGGREDMDNNTLYFRGVVSGNGYLYTADDVVAWVKRKDK